VTAKTAWVQKFVPRPSCDLRLFCFHHAGVGAAIYRPWALQVQAEVEVCAIELPGRGNRLREPALESVGEIVALVLANLLPELDRPFFFFGHSMGAVLAYETALALAESGHPVPEHLFVSGRRPPHVPDPMTPLGELPVSAFVEEINRRYGGIRPELLAHPDVMELLLPALRADIRALDRHRPAHPRKALPCPITAMGGDADAVTPAQHLEAWRPLTTAAFALKRYGGDHFYLDGRRAELLTDLAAAFRVADLSRG
jgi:medium-chain acyl-[acyl-carrier-protein] hydrolase